MSDEGLFDEELFDEEYEEDSDDEFADITCAICQDDECTHTKMKLECHHVFHAHCLASWFRENPACPLCRDDPVMEPVCVRERASLVRRFSKTKRAPRDLKNLVKQLQDKEFSRKERRQAYDLFKRKHSKILKELTRLKNSLRCAYYGVDRAVCRLGVYHCEGMPVPPLRGE